MNNISYTILKLTNGDDIICEMGQSDTELYPGSKPTSNYYHQTGYIQRYTRGT